MALKIIYQNPTTGNLAIITASPRKDISDLTHLVPAGVAYEIVEDSIIPTDRDFRNSWTGNNIGIATTSTTVTEDITKAKVIHQDKIRIDRKKKLQALDIEFQQAQETSAGITTIVAKKQALRDAPAASGIATAANTTELKAQWDTSILGTSPYS